MSILGGLAVGAGLAAVGKGMGLATRKGDNRAQLKQQEKLTKLQEESNSRLMGEAYGLQTGLYDHTYNKNTPAQQVKNLKEAGLNPALMYGLGGQGGATTGSGGASVGGSQASDVASMQQADNSRTGMALQAGMMQSQIELNKSVAKKNEAEADKTAGVDTEAVKHGIANLKANTENTEAKTILTGVETNIQRMNQLEQNKSHEDRMQTIKYNAYQAVEDVERAQRENKIGNETAQDAIKIIQEEAIGAGLKNEMTQLENIGIKANTELTKTKINEIGQTLAQEWQKVGLLHVGSTQKWTDLNNEQRKLAIDTFKAQTEAEYKGVSQVTGKIMDKTVGSIWNLTRGVDKALGLEGGQDWDSKKIK